MREQQVTNFRTETGGEKGRLIDGWQELGISSSRDSTPVL
jgi:hypothetical protein